LAISSNFIMGCGGSKTAEERAAERMDAEIAKTAAADAEAERQKIKLLLLGVLHAGIGWRTDCRFTGSLCDVQALENLARAQSSNK
jgi:hypothetical protein